MSETITTAAPLTSKDFVTDQRYAGARLWRLLHFSTGAKVMPTIGIPVKIL